MSEARTTEADIPPAPEEPEAADAVADRPIETRGQDTMGRRSFAEHLAQDLLAAPRAGFVVALTGAWGSGKTSILNMAVDALGEDAIVIHFNPWMFSGTEALVTAFFSELSKQLGRKRGAAKQIAEKLAVFGRLLSPAAGLVGASGAVDTAAGLLAKAASDPSVYEEHETLRRELAALGTPLVVVVDDVDRLRPEEVRDIVRLVRLVGDFPNTLYLLAFDRQRVEECLGEQDIARGRAYLEKIVQVTYDVPLARDEDLTALLVNGLGPVLEGVTTGPLVGGDWQNLFAFVVRPLLRTPRDVRRYLQSLPMTLRMVGDEVALADLLTLEAIRVLSPAMFTAMIEASDVLTPSSSLALGAAGAGAPGAANPLSGLAAVDPKLASAISQWLFPAAGRHFGHTGYGSEWFGTWRAQRRVASHHVFRYYLERQLPAGVVPARTVDAVLAGLTEPDQLRTTLATLSGDELVDTFERLPSRLQDLPWDPGAPLDQDPAVLGLPVLMDQLPRIPRRSPRETPAGWMVAGVAYRLLKRITDEAALAMATRAVVGNSTVISARILVVRMLGHEEHAGSKLVTEEVGQSLVAELRDAVVALPVGDWAADPSPITISRLVAQTDAGRDALAGAVADDRFFINLLADAGGVATGQAIGAAAVQLTPMLNWDFLVKVVGEDALRRRVGELTAAVEAKTFQVSEGEAEVLVLAARYATGWRPDGLMQALMNATTGTPQSDESVPPSQDEPQPDE